MHFFNSSFQKVLRRKKTENVFVSSRTKAYLHASHFHSVRGDFCCTREGRARTGCDEDVLMKIH